MHCRTSACSLSHEPPCPAALATLTTRGEGLARSSGSIARVTASVQGLTLAPVSAQHELFHSFVHRITQLRS
jgi:hypothetical protein